MHGVEQERSPLDRSGERRSSMPAMIRARLRAAIVAIAPTVLLVGFVYHPYIAPPTDPEAIATAAASDTMRWGLAHLAIGVGYGLVVLAFLAIRSYLREAGEERWSVLALPFIVIGSTLFVVLTGMEIGLVGAAEAGSDVQAVQSALFAWFIPTALTGALCFALGAVGFAMGIVRSGVLGLRLTRLVAGALVVMAAARFVPLSVAPYVIAVAAMVALWPLAYEMWKHPEAARPATQPRARLAT
jgi:hypothetical protein